jgi:predicted rRNA methylase YqxC with S4 and FtsJ domains
LILKILISQLKIPEYNVLFYGSSAGGFMSLMLAGMFDNSIAVVNNPQTVVHNYYQRHVLILCFFAV